MSLITADRRSRRCRFAGCLEHSRSQDCQDVFNPRPEQRLFLGTIRSDETNVRGKNRAPPRQITHLAERRTGCVHQGGFDAQRQRLGHRREIHDRSGDPGRTGHDVGTEDRQIKARVWEPDAVKDLQVPTKAGQLQVDLADTAAAEKLVADEQIIAFQLPIDTREIALGLQRFQLWQAKPGPPDRLGQGGNQGGNRR